MTRRQLKAIPPVASEEPSTPHLIWLDSQTAAMVRESLKFTGRKWVEWTANAIARLQRESDEELSSLLYCVNQRDSRADKQRMTARLYPETLKQARALALKYNCNIQQVFTQAFFMEALAATPAGHNNEDSVEPAPDCE